MSHSFNLVRRSTNSNFLTCASGVVVWPRDAPPPTGGCDGFSKYVKGLPVFRPADAAPCEPGNVHSEEFSSVGKIWVLGAKAKDSQSNSWISDQRTASVVSSSDSVPHTVRQRVPIESVTMSMYFGPWNPGFCTPITSVIPPPSPPNP
jgi:hypothetical protein